MIAKPVSFVPIQVMVKPYKGGKVIVFADDMNFRSYFFGTSKLFMNALFYNKCM